MGVRIKQRNDGREEILCRCDHPGCGKTASRISGEITRYCQRTGEYITYSRKPVKPFPYWKKVFRNGGKRSSKFMLYDRKGEQGRVWTDDVFAYCLEHEYISPSVQHTGWEWLNN